VPQFLPDLCRGLIDLPHGPPVRWLKMLKLMHREVDYLRTAEVAEIFGVTKQTLLNWLRRGLITEPERNPDTGYRLWTEKDVEAIRRFVRERRS
jgi:hypothetical protein